MSILSQIGNTPLVEIKNIWKSGDVRIYAKLEGMNPGGSIKDRVALHMIEQAVHDGDLKPGMEVIEATSGNTGIGLALVCAAYKFPCTIVMPKSVSEERKQMCRAFGAYIIEIDGNTDTAIKFVNQIIKVKKGCYYNPNQFDNANNWKTHFLFTAPEISSQLQNLNFLGTGLGSPNPNILVAACGTTGTIVGCKSFFNYNYERVKLWKLNEVIKTKTVGVFPKKDSKIQGLKNLRFQKKPKIYDSASIDKRVMADDKKSFDMTRILAREEGIFCGVSSGAAMRAAIREAKKLEYGTIVVIFPDNGYRYLSEGIF